ncbi:MAG: hypothetical protein KA152_02375 [Verrucomicrobiales bacterium]|nr:hypothetical protein [Verrucomicrobiales bacterium]
MENSESPEPVSKPKVSILIRVILGVCGIVVMAGGIRQMADGLGIGSGMSREVKQLLAESDAALEEANRLGQEASPIFQDLLNKIDSDGLDVVRSQMKESAQKSGSLMGQAATSFQAAAKKLDEAVALKPDKSIIEYLMLKSQSYGKFAGARSLNEEIARMVMDGSIPTINDLTPKVLDAARRRDEMEAAAVEIAANAEVIAAKKKG